MAVSFLLSDNNTLAVFLNGLGCTTLTCVQTIAGILVRIAFLVLLVPKTGIRGYLIGTLVSQILVCIAHFSIFKPSVSYRFSGLEIHPAAAFIYSRFNFIFTDVLPFIAVFRNGLTVFPAFYRCLLCRLYFCGINKIFISDSRTHPAVSCPK